MVYYMWEFVWNNFNYDRLYVRVYVEYVYKFKILNFNMRRIQLESNYV